MAASLLEERLKEHEQTIESLRREKSVIKAVERAEVMLVRAYGSGNKLLICGNGGSAADSQHIATELVSRFMMEREALDAEALTINTSTLTAIGNDYSFDRVFARQVEAKGNRDDVLLAISTSGNSRNVVEAMKTARKAGLKVIGMTGNNTKSLMNRWTDICINVPSSSTPRIQEAHILIAHILCEAIERELFGMRKGPR